ncbi:hypothetical protein [Abiotrophia defectiva]|uniref:hypothetical protein n=1 Tax=Abiotrophia defectiva TaxID=46125 RepID=UPI0030D0E1E6
MKIRFTEQIGNGERVAYEINNAHVLKVSIALPGQETSVQFIDLSKIDLDKKWYCSELIQSVEKVGDDIGVILVHVMAETDPPLEKAMTEWHEAKTSDFVIDQPVKELQGQTQGTEESQSAGLVTVEEMERQIAMAVARSTKDILETVNAMIGEDKDEETA